MKILQEVERRNGAYPARNWKFESISLQRTVRLLREVARRGREPRLFARVCRLWEVVRSAETGIGPGKLAPTGDNVSVGPDSSTAVPVM